MLVVERGEAGMGASTANAGSLHVQLLTYDFDGESDRGPAIDRLPLGPRSIALWREIAAESGEALGIRTEGGLMLVETAAEFAWARAKVAVERAGGWTATCSAPTSCARSRPISARISSAPASPRARARSTRCAAPMRCAAWPSGPAPGCRRGWRSRPSPATAPASWCRRPRGPIRAGRVVNCAGAHAGRIGRMLGLDLPVIGTVQQVIATEAAAPAMRHLVAHAGRHLSLKQGDGGHLLVGGGWPGVLDAQGRPQPAALDRGQSLGRRPGAARALRGMHALRAWTGLAVEVDRAPLLGETPGVPGLFHAVTSNGYTLAPIAGRMTADAVLGRAAVPPEFSLGRFG